MRRILFIIILLLSLLPINNYYANSQTSEVDVEVIKYYNRDDGAVVELIVYNLTSNFYIKVSNSYDDNVEIYKSEDRDENFNIVIRSLDNYYNIKYTFEVYSNSDDNKDKLLKIIEKETYKLGPFALHWVCRDAMYYEYCDPFFDTDLDEKEFIALVKEFKENEAKTWTYVVVEIIKKYGLFVLIPIVIVSGFFVTRIILHKRSLKNENK